MKSRTTRRFRELLAAVYAKPPIYSARVGTGYRALGVLDSDTIVWYWIGSHADYDKLLARL